MLGEGTLGGGLPSQLGEEGLTEGTAVKGLGTALVEENPSAGRALVLPELGIAMLLTLLLRGNDTDKQDFFSRIALWSA